MKVAVPLLLMGLILTGPLYGQKNFKTEYHQFRFALHDLLDPDNPMRISNATAQIIESFLNEHSKEILNFRTAQLEEYEREPIEDKSEYITLGEAELQALREQAMLISSKETLIKMLEKDTKRENLNGPKDNKDIHNLSVLLKLQSVSPIELIFMTNSQLLPLTFHNCLDFPSEKIATAFRRLGITGVYPSAKRMDKVNWVVTVNSYFMVSRYSVNTTTGDITLMGVIIRKQ